MPTTAAQPTVPAMTERPVVPTATGTPKPARRASGFTLTSPAFADGQAIPSQYTGAGADVSPPLEWTGAPKSTAEFALVCEDPDAPDGDFVHWVVFGLPPETTSLAEGFRASGLTQGRNDFGQAGYKGPAPPPGRLHHYRFRLMALDTPSGLKPNADKRALRAAVRGHVLAEAEWVGTYRR
jgi:Raf kinase inhibitor-like YbhB/YbcL family protein